MPQATAKSVKAAPKGTIKTAVKAAVKSAPKAPVKALAKPAAKPTEIKVKIGEPIKFRGTRTGLVTEGRFAGRTKVEGANGEWFKVNIAAKGKPAEIKLARASQIVR